MSLGAAANLLRRKKQKVKRESILLEAFQVTQFGQFLAHDGTRIYVKPQREDKDREGRLNVNTWRSAYLKVLQEHRLR
jgi:hypothetical protein